MYRTSVETQIEKEREKVKERERGRDDCAIAEAENGARLPGTLLGQVFFLSFFGQKVCRKSLYQGVATLTRLSIIYTQTLNVSGRFLTPPPSWPCPTAACTFIVPLLLWHVPERERGREREKKIFRRPRLIAWASLCLLPSKYI